MKSARLSLILVALLTLILMAGAAWARGGHGGGGFRGGGGGFRGGWHGHGGHYHGSSSFGFYFGYPFGLSYGYGYGFGYPYYAPYYYSYYYSAPTVVVPPMPPVYIEQSAKPTPQSIQPNAWSYCAEPDGYYPHVRDCPGGWQEIQTQPAGEEPGYWYYCANPSGYYPYVKSCSVPWRKLIP